MIQVHHVFVDKENMTVVFETATEKITMKVSSLNVEKKPEPYRENWNPDWKGDPDDPDRWKGW